MGGGGQFSRRGKTCLRLQDDDIGIDSIGWNQVDGENESSKGSGEM